MPLLAHPRPSNSPPPPPLCNGAALPEAQDGLHVLGGPVVLGHHHPRGKAGCSDPAHVKALSFAPVNQKAMLKTFLDQKRVDPQIALIYPHHSGILGQSLIFEGSLVQDCICRAQFSTRCLGSSFPNPGATCANVQETGWVRICHVFFGATGREGLWLHFGGLFWSPSPGV